VVLRRVPALTSAVAVGLAIVVSGSPLGSGAEQAAASTLSARPAPPAVRVATQAADRSALLRALRAGSAGEVRVRRDAAGRVRTVGTTPGAPLEPVARGPALRGGEPAGGQAPRTATDHPEPAAAARAFVGRYGPLFGVPDPAAGLVQAGVESTDAGDVVRFTQRRNGLPVVAGELTVSVNDEGSVLSAAGETSIADAGGALTVPPEQARETALLATAAGHALALDRLTAGEATAWAYDPSLIGAPGLPGSRPVWRIEVSSVDSAVRELVLVDGSSGRVAFHVNQVAAALDRAVCDARNQRGTPKTCTKSYVRTEGQRPSGLREADLAYDNVGRTADFFDRVLGVDLTRRIGSDTGDGRKLRSTVRWCDTVGACPMRNAFWNGEAMIFGDGFAGADDVVAHELTHGVTQSTGGLFYYYQSGAINESMSDVFGELVDLTDNFDLPGTQQRWRIGEDTPFGAIRDMKDPTRYGQPPRMRSLRYTSDRDYADNGGVHVNSGVGNKAAYLIADGGSYRGTTIRGLGLTKTAKIYWQALQALTSGSDYGDLFAVLPQACRDLVPTTGLRRGDCGSVVDAVTATQMHRQPRRDSAKTPEAAVCPTGSARRDLLVDGMEAGIDAGWKYNDPTPTNQDPTWSTFSGYAHGGKRSMRGWTDMAGPTKITMRRAVTVPSSGAYVRFAHAYDLRSNWSLHPVATGTVLFSVNGGRWRDAHSRLPVSGQGYEGASPAPGFTTTSHGYVSTRYDVSDFAGQRVRFRLRLSTANAFEVLGWHVDDFAVYSCG